MTKKSPKQRPPKKTVSIEVRVSEEDRRDFIEACRTADRSASSAFRGLMRVFVLLQRSRHRMFATMTRLLFRPVRMALASIGAAAALSMSLVLAPSASADMTLAYQVALDDGAGVIVSMGEVDAAANGVVRDRLGEDVRFELSAQPCNAETPCADDRPRLVLSLWDYRDGELVTATDQGIDVLEAGETRYETRMANGRTLTILLAPKADT